MPKWRDLAALPIGLLIAALIAPQREALVHYHRFEGGAEGLFAHLANHTIVHIGGAHRSGTTLLWAGLGSDSRVASQRQDALSPAPQRPSGAPRGGRHDHERDRRELHGEGIFLQDVYPRFALDHPPSFFIKRRVARTACAASRALRALAGDGDGDDGGEEAWPFGRWLACGGGGGGARVLEGVGSYGLSARSHLDGHCALAAAPSTGLRLFGQWAHHWARDRSRDVDATRATERRTERADDAPLFEDGRNDDDASRFEDGRNDDDASRFEDRRADAHPLARPLLLEKSPSNIRVGGLLAAAWARIGLRARFVMATRHPLAHAAAMRAFVDDLSAEQSVRHWLALEESLRRDARRGGGGGGGVPPRRLATVSLEVEVAERSWRGGRVRGGGEVVEKWWNAREDARGVVSR